MSTASCCASTWTGPTLPTANMASPLDNPLRDWTDVDEIFAYGLRNPFSFSFDRADRRPVPGRRGPEQSRGNQPHRRWRQLRLGIKEGTFFFDPNGANAGYVTDTPVVACRSRPGRSHRPVRS